MPPITVRGVGIEKKGDRLLAVFALSKPTGHAWVQFFTERAGASPLNLAATAFRRNRLLIDLPERSDLEMLIRSVEAIIEASNVDVQFRTAHSSNASLEG